MPHALAHQPPEIETQVRPPVGQVCDAGAGGEPVTLRARTPKPSSLPASGQTTLPDDLLSEQSLRVQLFYLMGAGLWAITFAMDSVLAPQGDRGPYRSLFEAVGVGLSLACAAYVRYGYGPVRTRIDVGVAFVVVHGFLLGLVNNWTVQPPETRPLSPNIVLILFLGLLAPTRPERLLVAGLAAAFMDPVGVWIAHLRGLPVPDPVTAVLLFYPNYVCALLAVAPSRLLYRLGREIRKARALGSYTLIERLGEGGMGEVWLGQHRLLASQAAIKLIRPDRIGDGGSDPSAAVGRFEREAQATAALTSPHTIRLFDYGVTKDRIFYYVMERLHGRDLESLVERFGPLPAARVLHLIRQVCRSLAEAHAAGFVHRDIKPANIYVCRMGLQYDFVKVLDFGLVRHENRPGAPTMVTAKSVTLGTPAYMAPEVILGEREIDRRADVYAIGCVAYYLLTGTRVFDGATPMKVLMQHVHETPAPPSDRSELEIPASVDALVMTCLAKDPDRRPRNASALLHLVDACRTPDTWDEEGARTWWHEHLPELTELRVAGHEST